MKKSGKNKSGKNKGNKRKLVAIAAACVVVIVMAVIFVPRLADTDTVRIRDWHDLHRVRGDLAGSYVLMNDLDATTAGYGELAGPTAGDGKGWEPIGQAFFLEEGIVGDPFEGAFDGRGHEIRDVFIARSDENTVGLFGIIGEGAVVHDVGIVGANVTGHFTAGALAATNLGSVSNCYSSGMVTGNSGAGGLVGANGGAAATISGSYSTASVSGYMVVGGLLGANSRGTVRDSYATGDVSRVYGTNVSFGGFVGRNIEGKIVNSYSAGSVHYQDEVVPTDNGFSGSAVTDGGYEMTGNFWDTQASGQPSTEGEATGMTTAEMMDIATYSGWSITAVDGPDRRNTGYTWNIVDGETYPFLSWQPVS